MVKRRHITRGKPAPAPAKKVVRKAVDEDEIDDIEDELDDDEVDVEDELDDGDEEVDVEDEPEPAPAPRRVSRKVVEEEVADEDDEPAPVKKAAKPVTPPVKPVKAEKAPALAVIKSVDTVVAENVFAQLLESLDDGKAIVITKIKDNKWQLTVGIVAAASGRKMSGAQVWQIVANPEFLEWSSVWTKKNFEEKKKYAKKIGVTWEPDDDPRVEIMRITQAVRAKENIEKYRPEYRSRAARAALRSG